MDKNISLQIQRIKGQINGIEKMLDEQRDNVSIVQQISAVKAGLSKVATDLLKLECEDCFNEKGKEQKLKKFENLVSTFFKINK